MTPSVSSAFVAVAMNIWKAVGAEIVIFVMTLAFAMAFRTFSGSRQDGKQCNKSASPRRASNGGNCSQKIADVQEETQEKEQLGGKDNAPWCKTSGSRAPASGVGERPRDSGERIYARSVGGQGSSTKRLPWTVMDEIIDGMREQQNIKFASHALTLYDEFRGLIGDTDARTVWRWSKHAPPELYNTLVNCAVRASRPHLIPNLVDDMIKYGVNRSLVFYESAMKQLAGQKQHTIALAVYDRLEADGLQPSAVTCSCLVGFAAEVGEIERAITFFERLSKITTPSIRAYMTILRVYAKQQDWPSSVAIIRDMMRRGAPLDSLALNIALATGVAADRLDEVTALVEETDARKPPIPDVVSYNTLIKGCAQRGDAAGVGKAFERMKNRGLCPNAITYNTAMDAMVRSGKSDGAWKFLADMRSSGRRPDKFTCSILVKGLSRSPNIQHVEGALDLLREVDGVCDASLKATLYQSVLEAAVQLGGAVGSELATKTFSQMRQKHVTPTAAAQRMVVKALPPAIG